MTAIEFENVGKQYRLGLVSTRTLSHDLNRWWLMNVLHREDPYLKIGEVNNRTVRGNSDYVWALKDINFKVEQGDVVGIIGRNGAGKSTLLKLLSKVTGPSSGVIRARGRIGSLLEVGTGFHPEMTGRENIYMNGAILGMSKAEITRKLDEIVDFSGCERYLDTPVKRYSSGMMVRLGFAVAAHLDPEILVVDEVLAVGDAEFQKKAIGKMKDVSQGEGRTVLFVSHNMDSVLNLCKTGVLLDRGKVTMLSGIEEVVSSYVLSPNSSSHYYESEKTHQKFRIQSVVFTGSPENRKGYFKFDSNIKLAVSIYKKREVVYPVNCIVGIVIYSSRGTRICTVEHSLDSLIGKENVTVHLTYPEGIIAPGTYYFQVAVHVPNVEVIEDITEICHFRIIDTGTNHLKYNDNNGFLIVNPKVEEVQ